ncbi:MAG: hypothetical protein K2H87_09060 [Duncaniella sp.]|nr:hypothetical protein [Duncaniella sp.]
MELLVYALTIISIAAVVIIEVVWRRMAMRTSVTDKVLESRRRLKYFEIFTVIVAITSIIYSYEFLTGEEMNGLACMFYVGLFFGWNRVMLEPYYKTDIIPELDRFSLYLRSFELDKQNIFKNRNAFTRSGLLPEKLEKVFCSLIRKKIAVVYSIGDPGTISPTTQEAASIYANDQEWQRAVARLTEKAEVILLRLGDTEGCRWEVMHCFERGYVGKTIFVVDDVDDLRFIESQTHTPLPAHLYEYDFRKASVGLYMDDSNTWHHKILGSKKNIEYFLDELLNEKSHLRKPKVSFKAIRSARSGSKWWDRLSLLFNPIAYVLYNRWSWKSITAFVVYEMVALLALFCMCIAMSDNEDEYVGALILFGLPLLFICTLPWLWYGPKYSAALNSWGGTCIAAKANKSLAVWMITYAVLATGLAMLVY